MKEIKIILLLMSLFSFTSNAQADTKELKDELHSIYLKLDSIYHKYESSKSISNDIVLHSSIELSIDSSGFFFDKYSKEYYPKFYFTIYNKSDKDIDDYISVSGNFTNMNTQESLICNSNRINEIKFLSANTKVHSKYFASCGIIDINLLNEAIKVKITLNQKFYKIIQIENKLLLNEN
jgi:hypothetical protein